MAIKINTYIIGNLIRVTAAFTDPDNADAPIDPTAVNFTFKDPTGNSTTYLFGIDSQLVKDSVGNYHVDIDINQSGTWHYKFFSTGTGQAAERGQFKADNSPFD